MFAENYRFENVFLEAQKLCGSLGVICKLDLVAGGYSGGCLPRLETYLVLCIVKYLISSAAADSPMSSMLTVATSPMTCLRWSVESLKPSDRVHMLQYKKLFCLNF